MEKYEKKYESRSSNPIEAYMDNYDSIMRLLSEIEIKVKKHKRKFDKTDQRNFGFAGDLGHVKEELEDVYNFIAGGM